MNAAVEAALREHAHEPLQANSGTTRHRLASDFSTCLTPLLEALNWRGDPVDVAEALPHHVDAIDLVGLRNTLANLGFLTRPLRIPLNRIDPNLAPCLWVPDSGGAKLLLAPAAGGLAVFDGKTGGLTAPAETSGGGTAYFISRREEADGISQIANNERWFATVTGRFSAILAQALALSMLLNLLALGAPIFVMMVYDQVIATGSYGTLAYLGAGMVVVIAFDAVFRAIRGRILAYIGARISMIVGAGTFEQLMHLPTGLIEGSTVGAQMARLKQFEVVRDFFTGPLALVYLELAFMPLFFLAIAVLGGPLAVIPLVMIALFAVTGAIIFPRIGKRVSESSRAVAERQSFLVETLTKMRSIKTSGSEDIWRDRLRDVSARAALGGFRVGQLVNLIQTIANVLMLSAGIATLAFGILRVLDGAMTVGALVAVMALVWRVLSPLQAGFVSLTRLERVRISIRQINSLMRLAVERKPIASGATRKHFPGRVTFAGVSLRYRPETEPALIGISFDVRPGQIVGIVGPNGSGKSSLLKLILGLYHPQIGGLLLDGLDIRQIEKAALRKAVAYLPQALHFFHGTIAQNMRLANPSASDEAISHAAAEAGILDVVLSLPDRFETRIGDQTSQGLPEGFLQGLSLARTYVKQASVLLFDEPANSLDQEGDRAFMTQLDRLRGQSTVFVVTHRPSHMRMMDRLLVLNRGALRFDGPPTEVLPKLADGFQ